MKYLKIIMISSVALLSACTSTEQLNEQSARNYTQVVAKVKSKGMIETKTNTARRIQKIFYKMLPIAKSMNETGVPFDWEMTVVRSKEHNAWAMPGGKMMFYTALVEDLKLNDEEIATIIGHEMAHALKEHTKSSQSVNIATTLGAIIGKEVLNNYGISTEIGDLDMVLIAKDLGVDKPFSRKLESDADEMGLMLMARSGFDPRSAPQVWQKMTKVSGDTISFFSTHPSNADRQENLNRLLPKALELYKASRY